MNRRKNHKILRQFKNSAALETTFEMNKSDAMNKIFNESAEHILVHYSTGMNRCVIDDKFAYFYKSEQDGSLTFSSTAYSGIGFIAHEHYSCFEDVHTVFNKFNKTNDKLAEQFFLDAYAHFLLQKNANFTYSYNLSNGENTEDGNHVVIYDITGDLNLNLEFHFVSSTVVLRCRYKDSKKTKNIVKIFNGSFEYVCKRTFTEAEILSCLDDETIDFNSNFNEIFRLSEIVDF